MKWRQDNTYVGLRGRTEPNHCKGSAQLYGTGAQVVPLDDWQRGNFHPAPPAEARYAIYAWVKRGHLADEKDLDVEYALTVEEGKRRCDDWLDANVVRAAAAEKRR